MKTKICLTSLLLAGLLLLTLFSCGKREITLCGDMSVGSSDGEAWGLIHYSLRSDEEATPENLAAQLTDWTGYDFHVNSITKDGGKLTVDWSVNSTLLAGLDDREMKEPFIFYDQASLNWFLMDSLWKTLLNNTDAEEVYYTMDGGKELTLEELYPIHVFPTDIPYMGSPFYYAHADVQGD